MIHLAPMQAVDLPEIETLLDQGFGPARRNRTAYRLRDGVSPALEISFVARDDGGLVGSVQCWPLRLRGVCGATHKLVLLGPVATAVDYRGQGVATRLVNAALAAIDAGGAPPVLLIGDESFYGRFGFSAAATGGWQLPGPVERARLLLRGGAGLPAIGTLEPAAPVRRAA